MERSGSWPRWLPQMVKYAYCGRRICAMEVRDMRVRINSVKTINLAFSIIYSTVKNMQVELLLEVSRCSDIPKWRLWSRGITLSFCYFLFNFSAVILYLTFLPVFQTREIAVMMMRTYQMLCGTGRISACKGKACLTYSFICVIIRNFTDAKYDMDMRLSWQLTSVYLQVVGVAITSGTKLYQSYQMESLSNVYLM